RVLAEGSPGPRTYRSPLVRQSVLVVSEDFVGASAIEDGKAGAMIRDFPHVVHKAALCSFATYTKQSIPKRLCDRLGLRFAGLPGKFRRQLLSLGITNIECHVAV